MLDFAAGGIVKSQLRVEKMDKLTEVSGNLMTVGDGVIDGPIDKLSLCRFFKK